MRRIIYSVASSLDGYIAGPQGEFDWIPTDPEFDWDAFANRFDTALMGRKTYELMCVGEAGISLPDMRIVVFSTTLDAADHPDVTVVSSDATRAVAELREADGKDIWLMGGGMLFRSLLEADLVDGVEVGVIPILLGEGLPLLATTNCSALLELNETRRFPSGIVLLNYDVVHDEELADDAGESFLLG